MVLKGSKLITILLILILSSSSVFAFRSALDNGFNLLSQTEVLLESDSNGTTNYIPSFYNSSYLTNSIIYSDMNMIGIGTITPNSTLDVNGNVTADYFIGNINVSYIQNEHWVDESGDTMTGNLSIYVPLGDASLVIDTQTNKDSCLVLQETDALGFNFCYDGSGTNRWVVKNNADDILFQIERDEGNAIVTNNLTADYYFGSGAFLDDLNVSGNLTSGDISAIGYTISANYLSGIVGIMDIRGDPWWLAGTDLEIDNDLKVNNTEIENELVVGGNVTADYFIGNGSQLTGIDSGSTDGYFNSLVNFTGTLSDEKFCTYDNDDGIINCTSEGGVDTNETTRMNTIYDWVNDNHSNWDIAYLWGDHGSEGYITDGNTNWNNIYGFVTDANLTETDPIANARIDLLNNISTSDMWNRTGESLYLSDTSNYVGIGTTDPNSTLHVNGNLKVKNITMGNGTFSGTYIGYNGSCLGYSNSSYFNCFDNSLAIGSLIGYFNSADNETDPIANARIDLLNNVTLDGYFNSADNETDPIANARIDLLNNDSTDGYFNSADNETDPIANARIDLLNNDSTDGYYNSLGNFTGTLTDEKFCTYDDDESIINCTSEGGIDTNETTRMNTIYDWVNDNHSNWDTAYLWGDHGLVGYITDGNTNWNNIYGFVTDANLTETDSIANARIDLLNNDSTDGYYNSADNETDPVWVADKANYANLTYVNANNTAQEIQIDLNTAKISYNDSAIVNQAQADIISLQSFKFGYYYNKTVTTYNGELSSGGFTGYKAANYICNSTYPNTHMCTMVEVINTIQVRDISSMTNEWLGTAWVHSGAPKFTPASQPVNDCAGWTESGSGVYRGSFWIFDSTTGGQGGAIHCASEKSLACCMS